MAPGYCTALRHVTVNQPPSTSLSLMSLEVSRNEFQIQQARRWSASSVETLREAHSSKPILSFSRDDAPAYAAVSYMWGEGDPTEVVYLNGRIFYVRTNLWSCLHYLGRYACRPDWPKYIWVDAICIDQTNIPERNEQVRFMDQIYKNAECVSVWLGLPPAADQYESFWPEPTKTFDYDNFFWSDHISELANRPYWCRIWVIQEFLLGRDVFLFCGENCIDWITFKSYLARETDVNVHSIVDEDYNAAFADPNTYKALPLVVGRDPDRNPEFLQPLSKLLVRYRFSKCEDQSDRVFALLGLIKCEERVLLDYYFPDYTLSKRQVLILTLAHLSQSCFGGVSLDSEELFLALGIEQMAERRTLLRRAERFNYSPGDAAISFRDDLALHDEWEFTEPSVNGDLMDTTSTDLPSNDLPSARRSLLRRLKVFTLLSILALFVGAASWALYRLSRFVFKYASFILR
ncbi:MAG: hypothetical protein M1820_001444 [Bogoriella megaspora]|nr:MAG: hypothetical protein M1820_001444 [Bogoriella megaspora]